LSFTYLHNEVAKCDAGWAQFTSRQTHGECKVQGVVSAKSEQGLEWSSSGNY